MKNQYAGDIGDFSKFVLCRHLDQAGHKVGISWYVTPDDGRTDGRFRTYLDPKSATGADMRALDEHLYDDLQPFRGDPLCGVRSLQALPSLRGLVHAGDPEGDATWKVPHHAVVRDRPTVRRNRFEAWMDRLEGRHVVVMDPDNGLATSLVRPSRERGWKFVLPSELQEARKRFPWTIVYQHAARQGAFEDHVKGLLLEHGGAFALRWRRQQARAYLFFPGVDAEPTSMWKTVQALADRRVGAFKGVSPQ